MVQLISNKVLKWYYNSFADFYLRNYLCKPCVIYPKVHFQVIEMRICMWVLTSSWIQMLLFVVFSWNALCWEKWVYFIWTLDYFPFCYFRRLTGQQLHVLWVLLRIVMWWPAVVFCLTIFPNSIWQIVSEVGWIVTFV